MIARTTVLAALLLFAAQPPAHAQRLENVMSRVANSWARGDASGITRHGAREGLSLEVDRDPVGPLGARQASAVLRKLFDDRETVAVRPGLMRIVGGNPPRAFGELEWITRARGTTIPERNTVFIALIEEEDGWRVTEIRIMP